MTKARRILRSLSKNKMDSMEKEIRGERKGLAAKYAQKGDAVHTAQLVETSAAADVELAARSTTASKREFLSQQIDAGLFGRASEFTYSPGAVPMKYQSLHFSNKKIRKSPSDGTNEAVCMTRLVKLMITGDIANSR